VKPSHIAALLAYAQDSHATIGLMLKAIKMLQKQVAALQKSIKETGSGIDDDCKPPAKSGSLPPFHLLPCQSMKIHYGRAKLHLMIQPKPVFSVARLGISAPSVSSPVPGFPCIKHPCTLMHMVLLSWKLWSIAIHIASGISPPNTLSFFLFLTPSHQLPGFPRNPKPTLLPPRLRPLTMPKSIIIFYCSPQQSKSSVQLQYMDLKSLLVCSEVSLGRMGKVPWPVQEGHSLN